MLVEVAGTTYVDIIEEFSSSAISPLFLPPNDGLDKLICSDSSCGQLIARM